MKNQFSTKGASFLIISFVLVALFTASCKKQNINEGGDTGTGYKITFKVDGALKEFADENFPPSGNFYEDGTQYGGLFSATGYATSIGFRVYDTNAIIEKDYIGYVITPTSGYNAFYGAVVSYTNGQDSYSTPSINPTVHVEIKKITSTSVSGEFSGTLMSQNGKPDINVSEGKFYVRLNAQ